MNDQNDADKKTIEEKLRTSLSHLRTYLKTYDPEKYSVKILIANKENWIKKMEEAHANVVNVMLELQDKEWTTEAEKADVTKTVEEMESQLVIYITNINEKILENIPAPPVARADTMTADARAAKTAKIDAEIEAEKISAEVKLLKLEVNKQPDWSLAESHQIEVAMGCIAGWRTRFRKIKETLYSLRSNVHVHDFDDEELLASETAVADLETKLDTAIEDIEYEDNVRGLFSLSTTRAADVQFPMFQGANDEDFLKFQKEFLHALKINRIRKENKVAKLKECLKNQPRSLIHDNLVDIDEALGILRSMYGDPSRLTIARKSKLMALGPFPKPESKLPNHVKQQVEWLLKFELILKDLFELAEQNSDCFCEVYNTSMLKSIKGLFPYDVHQEFANYTGSANDILIKINHYVVQMRVSIQTMMNDLDDVPKGKLAASCVKKQVPVDTGQDIKLVGFGPDDPIDDAALDLLYLLYGPELNLIYTNDDA